MDEDEFWDTVGLLDRDRGGDDVAAAEPLVAYLATLPNGELFAFDDALAEHLRALDRRDVAERAFGPFRDRFFPGEFLGWRCSCVAGGKDCYAGALAGSSALPAGARFEELMFVPMKAWARKYGADPANYPHEPRPDFQTFDNAAGWE